MELMNLQNIYPPMITRATIASVGDCRARLNLPFTILFFNAFSLDYPPISRTGLAQCQVAATSDLLNSAPALEDYRCKSKPYLLYMPNYKKSLKKLCNFICSYTGQRCGARIMPCHCRLQQQPGSNNSRVATAGR